VKAFHEANPSSPGMTPQQLLDVTKLPKGVFDGIVDRMKSAGTLIETKGTLSHPGHEAKLGGDDQEHANKIEALYVDNLFSPPTVDEAAEQSGFPPDVVRKIVRLLVEHKRLVRVSEKQLFHTDAVERAKELLAEHFSREERLESVKFKYFLNTTRKYALPLLDYMDKIGVTRRVGNTRYRGK
jgi:selenocysteine-specific elongation factor